MELSAYCVAQSVALDLPGVPGWLSGKRLRSCQGRQLAKHGRASTTCAAHDLSRWDFVLYGVIWPGWLLISVQPAYTVCNSRGLFLYARLAAVIVDSPSSAFTAGLTYCHTLEPPCLPRLDTNRAAAGPRGPPRDPRRASIPQPEAMLLESRRHSRRHRHTPSRR